MVPQLRLSLHELHYNLGYLLHQQGDLAGAAQSYQQAIALHPNYANAHLNLAVVLDQQGQHLAAVRHYRQVVALRPDSVKAYNNLGCTLAKLKQLDEAVQVYQQAIALQPQWATLHNNLGQALFNQGKVAAAIAAYRHAINLQPDLALAHYNLGKALQQQGHHSVAIQSFDRTIQLEPSEPNNALPYSDAGLSWMAQGKLDRALSYFQKAIVHQSHLIQAYCDWTQHLEPNDDELTRARIACGRFLQALLQQTNPCDIHQHLATTCWHLANTLVTYGGNAQYERAQTYYQWVLQIQPDHLDAYLGLGQCLIKQGRSNATLFVNHLALAAYPNHPKLHRQLGQTLEAQGRFAEAISHYQQALGMRESRLDARKPGDAGKKIRNPGQVLDAYPLPQGTCDSTLHWMTTTNTPKAHYIALPSPSQSSPAPPSPLPDRPAPTCQGLNCSPCLKRIIDWFQLSYWGNGIYTCTMPDAFPVAGLPRFVATIPEGRVWLTPQQNDWLVCNAIAVLSPDNLLLADVSRDYPGQLPRCLHPHPSGHRLFTQESLVPPEQIEGKVAVLAGLSGHNYYHWMVDILPRFALLQQSGLNLEQIDWFLVNNNNKPFQHATLKALGIPPEKVLVGDRHPHIQAQQLIVPSFPGHLGWLEPWAMAFLRQQFLLTERSTGSTTYPTHIYISRAQANHRRVLNEAAILEQLQPFGIVPIQLESLPFVEQVALFANAQLIIAPHGGGLTNTLFCRPGTTVIELVNPHYIRPYYWVMSQQLGLKHYLVSGDALICSAIRQLMYPSSLMEDIWVNLNSLIHLLQKLLSP